MQITDTRKRLTPVTINGHDVPVGTVFTGQIDSIEGPWLRTLVSLINLRSIGHSYSLLDKRIHYSSLDKRIHNYESREAELVLK